jgi:hypothetical protein
MHMTEYKDPDFVDISRTETLQAGEEAPFQAAPSGSADSAVGRTAEGGAANPAPPEAATAENQNGTANWHVEAGRKGARRIHQLIERGRRYEQEHGLKRGRQRLRQLIQEGKLYEQEHGLKPNGQNPRRERPSRLSREQALTTLFQALLRLVRPAYRQRLLRVLEALEADPTPAEASSPRG